MSSRTKKTKGKSASIDEDEEVDELDEGSSGCVLDDTLDLSDEAEPEPPSVKVEVAHDRHSPRRLNLHELPRVGAEKAEKIYRLWDSPIADPKDNKVLYRLNNIMNIADMKPKKLAEITPGLGEQNANEVIMRANALCNTPMAMPINQLRVIHKRIKTGSINWDRLLGGGIRLTESYMWYGDFGVGKSQIMLQIVVRSYLPVAQGGLGEEGKPPHITCWFDTEGNTEQFFWPNEVVEPSEDLQAIWANQTWVASVNQPGYEECTCTNDMGEDQKYYRNEGVYYTPGRAEEIAIGCGVDYTVITANVLLTRMDSMTDQITRLEWWVENMARYNIQIVVMDSIMNHIRAEYADGRQQLPERSGKISYIMSMLHKMRAKCGAALLTSNQVSAKPDAKGPGGNLPRFAENACGGHTLLHKVNVISHMWKSGNERKVAELIDVNYLPSGKPIWYGITKIGVIDMAPPKGKVAEV